MNVKARKISQLHENNRLLVGDVGFLNDEGFRFRYSEAPSVPFHNARSIFNENRNLKNFKEGRNYENQDEPYSRNKKNRKRRNRSRYTYKNITIFLNKIYIYPIKKSVTNNCYIINYLITF